MASSPNQGNKIRKKKATHQALVLRPSWVPEKAGVNKREVNKG